MARWVRPRPATASDVNVSAPSRKYFWPTLARIPARPMPGPISSRLEPHRAHRVARHLERRQELHGGEEGRHRQAEHQPRGEHPGTAHARGGELPQHAEGDDLVGEEARLRVAGQQLQRQDDAEQGAVPRRRSAQQALERGQGHRHPGVGCDVHRAPRREQQGDAAVRESQRPGQGRRPRQPHLAPQPPGAEAGDGEIEDHRREQRRLAGQERRRPSSPGRAGRSC